MKMHYRKRLSREKAAAAAVWAVMKAKMKIDISLKMKKKKKTSNEKAKTSNSKTRWYHIIPVLLLVIVGSLIDSVGAKAINDNKAAQRQLEELKCHNRIIEDHGIYFVPYKRGIYFVPYKYEREVLTEKA